MTLKFKWTQAIILSLMKNITEKITAPDNYTVIFTQNYLETLLEVIFSSFQSNNVVKTPYVWKNPSFLSVWWKKWHI